jgi:chorismate--pyruvate lyase
MPALLDKGSLTARLVRASKGEFKVKVLYQGWQRPRRSEVKLLGLPERQTAIVREVALCCHGEPWVFARSVIPVTTLTGRLRHLQKFDDSALGGMLFKDRSMRRTEYELADFSDYNGVLPEELSHRTAVFGRRSCFYLDHKPLMVSEIFLDGFDA